MKTYRIICRQDGQTLLTNLSAGQLKEIAFIYPTNKYLYELDKK